MNGMPIAYMDAKSLPKGKKTIILYIGPGYIHSNLEPGLNPKPYPTTQKEKEP
jgi:hypothetical protein